MKQHNDLRPVRKALMTSSFVRSRILTMPTESQFLEFLRLRGLIGHVCNKIAVDLNNLYIKPKEVLLRATGLPNKHRLQLLTFMVNSPLIQARHYEWLALEEEYKKYVLHND